MPDKTIADFVEALVSDETLEARFLAHAVKTMEDFGLKQGQIDAVMDFKLKDLKDLIRQEVGGKDVVVFRVKMR